jgi:uncharacterized protein
MCGTKAAKRSRLDFTSEKLKAQMILGVPWHEFLWLVFAILFGGIVSGLLAGLFGVGGGSVIVPVLFEVFRVFGVPENVRMQLCLGTSIAIVIPTTIRSYLTHRAKGFAIPGIVRQWALPAVVGAGTSATNCRAGSR